MSRLADLFDYAERYPVMPGYKEGDTSRKAAESVAPSAARLRSMVLAELKRSPGTADEIAGRLGLSILSVRPRVTELAKMCQVEDTGERRANASGRSAKVMRAR